jgi:hypothetical protein
MKIVRVLILQRFLKVKFKIRARIYSDDQKINTRYGREPDFSVLIPTITRAEKIIVNIPAQ